LGPIVGLSLLLHAGAALAGETAAGPAGTRTVPLPQIITLLFLMLGPFKIIGPFARLTRDAEPQLRHRIALRAILLSSVALLLAAFVGERFLARYGVPLPVLALAAGIILFLVALQNVLHQFAPPGGTDAAREPPTMKLAISPLAFPTIVTPYGIAAVIFFIALTNDVEGKLQIGGVVLGIMLLNLVVMLLTRYIARFLGLFLQVLGAVLGIIQVALGLQIILISLRTALSAP
jgi:multiple antibiotic resistance protein